VIFKRHAEAEGVTVLLKWAIVFLIIAIVAAILGFGVIAGTAALIAKVLFIIFLILLMIALIFGWRGQHAG
jgi:uncharacterized membrane protein YtjA (UPF0391 family)